MAGSSDYNLARLAEQSLERRGDYRALLFEGRWHSSGELFERARRIAGGLAELGVRPGDRVVVTMANCPEVGIIYNALWRVGAVVAPATFLLSPAELRHVIADAEACGVVTTPEFVEKVRGAAAGIDSVRFVVSSGPAVQLAAVVGRPDRLRRSPGRPSAVAPAPPDSRGVCKPFARAVCDDLWDSGAA